MGQNENVHIWEDEILVFVGAQGASAPTTFSLDGNGNLVPPSGMVEIGLLSPDGLTEGHSVNENKVYDAVGSLIRIARNQEERPITFTALEDNPMVRKLRYHSTTTTTGATAAVQTVTISGSPTGGTFSLTLPGFGTATGLAYNASATVVQAALRAAWGLAVVNSGTLTSGQTVTFPAAAGAVPLATADGSGLTGGTSPAVAVVSTTPGVTGINKTPVGSGTGRDLRPWALAFKDGSVTKVYAVNTGEATESGTTPLNSTGPSESQFTLQPYKDSSGNFYTILDNDPAQGGLSV